MIRALTISLLLSIWAAPAFAQDAPPPENPNTRQTDQSEDDWRKSKKKRDSGDIFEDIFGEMMGGRGRSSGGRQRGADLRYNMEISLQDAYNGKTAEIAVPTSMPCKGCSGSGAKPGTTPSACSTCGGHGKVRAAQGFFTIERTCPVCQGRGQMMHLIPARSITFRATRHICATSSPIFCNSSSILFSL